MSQSDMVIADQPGASFLADLNTVIAALVTNNSGATEPATTYPYMWWPDTGSTPPMMRQRNAADDGWVAIFNLTTGAPVADSFVFRNRIINGNFSVNARAVSGTVALAAGQYGHDRWKAGASGCTYTFATASGVTTITITAGSLQQVIKGSNLDSGTHVLSWVGTAQGKIGAGSYAASGVTGSVTGGTNTTVEFGTGTLTKVMFELGTIPSVYENRMDMERQLCLPYCEAGWFRIDVYALNTSAFGSSVSYAVPKIAVPTVTFSGTGYSNAASVAADSASTATHLQIRAIANASAMCAVSTNWLAVSEL